MTIRKILTITLLFISIASASFAGKEAGDGELAILKEDGTYEVAVKHFIPNEYKDYKLSKEMKTFIAQLLKQTKTKLSLSILGTKKDPDFRDKIYGDLREFRLVDEIKGCKGYEEGELPSDKKFHKAACTQGYITYINRKILEKMDTLNFALLLIHEGIHSYDRSYSHEFIADIIRAIEVVETKFKIQRPLKPSEYLTKLEARALNKYTMRLAQLLEADVANPPLEVTAKGILKFEGAKVIVDEKSKVAPGSSFIKGVFEIKDSIIIQSLFEYKFQVSDDMDIHPTTIDGSTVINSSLSFVEKDVQIVGSSIKDSTLSGTLKITDSVVESCSSNWHFRSINFKCSSSKFDSADIEDSTIEESNLTTESVDGEILARNNSRIKSMYFINDFGQSYQKRKVTLDNTIIEKSGIKTGPVEGTLIDSVAIDSEIRFMRDALVLRGANLENSKLSLERPSGRSEEIPKSRGSSMSNIKISMINSEYRGGYFYSDSDSPEIIMINSKIALDGIAFNDKVSIKDTSINEHKLGGYYLLKGLLFLDHSEYNIDSESKKYCYIHNGTIFDSDERRVRKSNRLPRVSCD